MPNELILIVSLLVLFSGLIIWFFLFGEQGLMCWNAIATIAANIEVMILVDAFGMPQTLGNVLFASTFLSTDILSEISGKKQAQKAVNIGIATSITFLLISQSWFLYTPSPNDQVAGSIYDVFSNTPRFMLVGLLVYAITQRFDVWAYHQWWDWTTKKFGDRQRFLFLRNNGSTLISQLLNTLLFTAGAFWGTYDLDTLMQIALSSYIIFIFTSLLDTPFVYLARMLHRRRQKMPPGKICKN